MHPVGTFCVMFPYQLVEVAIVTNPVEPPTAFLHVAINAEVSGLPFGVLTVGNASYGLVQLRTTIAAAYLDGLTHRVT